MINMWQLGILGIIVVVGVIVLGILIAPRRSLICRHSWELVISTYAPAATKDACDAVFVPDSERLKLLSGVTTAMFKCKNCPAMHREELIGAEIKSSARVLSLVGKDKGPYAG